MSDRLQRWRLVLGSPAEIEVDLDDAALGMDQALDALYDRGAGLESSSPRVARWLGDIRDYFPTSVVQVMQKDAIERLHLHQLLLEPEVLESVEPDVHLVSTLVGLNRVIPEHTRETARLVVRRVVDEVERRLEQKTREAVTGALNRAARTSRPRKLADVDWNATIRANLRHYQADLHTVIPERLVGYARRKQAIERHILLCVDQSGSMASSVVYSSIFAAVLASIRSLQTSLVVFDTSVVDMTDQLADPVDVLFGVQLGGGTDIAQALRYTRGLITDPADSVVVLISDLLEGGNEEELRRRAKELVESGATVIVLLALSDDGAPAFDHDNAAFFASLGAPAFACSPDRFPELIAAAIERRDIPTWAAKQDITTSR